MTDDFSFLTQDAAGLALHDPADRAIFRIRVEQRLASTDLEDLKKLVNSPSNDRFTVCRSVADAYIRKNRDQITRAAIREKIRDEHRERLDW